MRVCMCVCVCVCVCMRRHTRIVVWVTLTASSFSTDLFFVSRLLGHMKYWTVLCLKWRAFYCFQHLVFWIFGFGIHWVAELSCSHRVWYCCLKLIFFQLLINICSVSERYACCIICMYLQLHYCIIQITCDINNHMSTVHSAYNKVAYNNFLISETYFFPGKTCTLCQ